MKRVLLAIVALVLLALVIAWMSGLLSSRVAPGLEPITQLEPEQTAVVEAVEATRFEMIPASVEARDTTLVGSRLLARVSSLTVRPGDTVVSGEVLATLEQEDLFAQVQQAREALNSIKARYDEAVLALERALQLRERQLLAQAALDEARANVASLQAQRGAAEQAVREAETALSWSTISAPIAGRVVERLVEPGDTVSPGQAILSLYNPSSLRVEAWVREALAVTLAPGMTLQVRVPALNVERDAAIEEIVPAADPASRSFSVRLLLPMVEGLLPGMYAQVAVPAGSDRVLMVPVAAVRSVGQLDVVWVAGAGGPERRFVRLGQRRGDRVEVVSGLSAGERLAFPEHFDQ